MRVQQGAREFASSPHALPAALAFSFPGCLRTACAAAAWAAGHAALCLCCCAGSPNPIIASFCSACRHPLLNSSHLDSFPISPFLPCTLWPLCANLFLDFCHHLTKVQSPAHRDMRHCLLFPICCEDNSKATGPLTINWAWPLSGSGRTGCLWIGAHRQQSSQAA